ncbi:hypothetical protein [Azospirillum argentinense]|uniref:phage tail protein n=1 Tax=Azospirillum argentinense TaxID=2970906 RepID=UPI0032DFBAA0
MADPFSAVLAVAGTVAQMAMRGSQVIEGQRLAMEDRAFSADTYGKAIPMVFGTVAVTGEAIWGLPLDEKEKRSGSKKGSKKGGGKKGGPLQRDWLYYGNAAYGFCEGEVGAYKRLWANGKLVYDASTKGLEGKTYKYDEGVYRFYSGSEDQPVDGVIDRHVTEEHGPNSCPAYRGLGYVRLGDFPLLDFNNSMPTEIKAEVVRNANFTCPTVGIDLAGQGLPGWDPADILIDPLPGRAYAYVRQPTRLLSWNRITGTVVSTLDLTDPDVRAMIAAKLDSYTAGQVRLGNIQPRFVSRPVPDVATTSLVCCVDVGGATAILMEIDSDTLNPTEVRNLGSNLHHFTKGVSVEGILLTARLYGGQNVRVYGLGVAGNGNYGYGYRDIDLPGAVAGFAVDPYGQRAWVATTDGAQSWITELGVKGVTVSPRRTVAMSGLVGAFAASAIWYDGLIDRVVVADGANGRFCSLESGDLALAASAALPGVIGTGAAAQQILDNQMTLSGQLYCTYGTTLTRLDTRSLTVLKQWEFGAGGHLAEQIGKPFTLSFAVLEPLQSGLWLMEGPPGNPAAGPTKLLLDRVADSEVTVASVVAEICRAAGLTDDQIDVAGLAGCDPIVGYVIPRPTTARAALEPLATAFDFDGAEIDGKLVFRMRGVEAVRDIDQGEVIVDEDSGGQERALITETIMQEAELPLAVSVSYQDPDADYEVVPQVAQRIRGVVTADNTLSVDLSTLALDRDTAARIAHRLRYRSWVEATALEFQVGPQHLDLDPTDVVRVRRVNRVGTMETTELILVRITETEVGANHAVRLKAIAADEGALDLSEVRGAKASRPVSAPIPFSTGTLLWLLNLPCLGAADGGNGGAWMALAPEMPDGSARWGGAVVFTSNDNSSYQQVAASGVAVPWARVLAAPVPNPAYATWDNESELVVRSLDPDFEFEGASDLDVLGGANLLLVGDELLQYARAELVASGTYRLTRLLRGRFGTEWACGDHRPGEYALPFSGGDPFQRFSDLAERGLSRYYKATSVGGEAMTSRTQTFVNEAAALKPYSVAHLRAASDGSGGRVLTWIRRTRFGGEWTNGTGAVPLNEASEQYEIDVFTVDGETKLSTLTTTTPTVTYSVAQYNADTGAAAAAMPTLRYDVYQISALVGRGFRRSITA